MTVEVTVNGVPRRIDTDPGRTLLDVVREELGLKATRFGCGEGLCGSCTVLVDGRAITSCNTPFEVVSGKHVVTLEGLGDADHPHPLQRAFVELQALQCGYCISGIMMAATALLQRNAKPVRADICVALDNHLCRCGAHNRILDAIEHAAGMIRGEATNA